MKLHQILIVAVSIIFLAACSEQTYEPREVNQETDVCQIREAGCTGIGLMSRAMLIPHPRGHGYSPLFPVRVVVSSVSLDSVSSYTILLRQS